MFAPIRQPTGFKDLRFRLAEIVHCKGMKVSKEKAGHKLTKVRHSSELTVGSKQQIHQVYQVNGTNGEEKHLESLKRAKHVTLVARSVNKPLTGLLCILSMFNTTQR